MIINLSENAEKMLPGRGVLYISVSDGARAVPVAAKKVPLGHFPLSLTLNGSNVVLPHRRLFALQKMRVYGHVSRDGSVITRTVDWYGTSEVVSFNVQQPLRVTPGQQAAGDNP